MTPDWLLLHRYAKDNSQEAFASLTARYLNLVYSVCLREVHDPDLAQDVTQVVFLLLARTAPSFRSKNALPGWLFRTARFAAQNARTREQRRKYYEEKAAAMAPTEAAEDASWSEIEPLLNQSLSALRERERECVLLRFFQDLTFAEVGVILGLSEEAARKRVNRSVEKMQGFFTKNGIIVPVIALPVLLTTHAAKAAPVVLSANIANLITSVLAGNPVAALTGSHVYQLSQGTLHAMKIAQLKIALGVTAVVLGVSTYAVTRTIAHPLAKPGYVYEQGSGKTLNAAQVAARCRAAYDALNSYEVTSNVTSQYLSAASVTPQTYQTSAKIQFVRPGKIRVEGKGVTGSPFAFISDTTQTASRLLNRPWKSEENAGMAIAGAYGISAAAGSTIPALLVGGPTGYPLTLIDAAKPEVREDELDGVKYYVLTGYLNKPKARSTESIWLDEKTFLLRRSVSDHETPAQTIPVNGQPFALPASKMHYEQNFTNEKQNPPIPDSTFTVPAVQ